MFSPNELDPAHLGTEPTERAHRNEDCSDSWELSAQNEPTRQGRRGCGREYTLNRHWAEYVRRKVVICHQWKRRSLYAYAPVFAFF